MKKKIIFVAGPISPQPDPSKSGMDEAIRT